MLTTKQIEHAKPKAKIYRLFDGLGLYLEIDPKGGKYWRLKYRYLGKEKRLAIGKYPEMPLLEARERRDEARKLVSNNIDPSAQKVERRHAALVKSATTFELVGREWHATNKDRWSAKHGINILHRLDMDVFPEIGKMPIADIKPIHLLSTLRLVENRGAKDEARRLLQYCGQIFRYPHDRPQRWHLNLIVGKRVVGLDFDPEVTHTNSHRKNSPNIPYMVSGPHIHLWEDNRVFCTANALPRQLFLARELPPNVQGFDNSLRYFCALTNINLPPDMILGLPPRETLL